MVTEWYDESGLPDENGMYDEDGVYCGDDPKCDEEYVHSLRQNWGGNS